MRIKSLILEDLNFHEVFNENYTLAEKITMFHHMKKYVTQSGEYYKYIL